MLEDDFNDCFKKATLGLGLNENQIAKDLGCSLKELSACLDGEENIDLIQSLGPLLGIDPERLLKLKNYSPLVNHPAELSTIVSPFGHLGVNAYILETQGTSIIFDTGTDSTELIKEATSPERLLITHEHPDHCAGTHHFAHCETLTPSSLTPGSTLGFRDLTIECIDVSGHFTPALAYLIHGLESPIAIIGDCLFAGSIGRIAASNYRAGLERIRENILSLPAETILYPGHGPATTVAQELAHNPFF